MKTFIYTFSKEDFDSLVRKGFELVTKYPEKEIAVFLNDKEKVFLLDGESTVFSDTLHL
jgi:hypothetical protein